MNFCLNVSKRYFPSIKCTFYNRFKTNPSNSNKITLCGTILDFMQIRETNAFVMFVLEA